MNEFNCTISIVCKLSNVLLVLYLQVILEAIRKQFSQFLFHVVDIFGPFPFSLQFHQCTLLGIWPLIEIKYCDEEGLISSTSRGCPITTRLSSKVFRLIALWSDLIWLHNSNQIIVIFELSFPQFRLLLYPFPPTWRVTVIGVTADRRACSKAATKSFNVFSDPPTNHVIVAIEGRPSAVFCHYGVGRVYCEGQSPAFIVAWVVTLHHSIISKDLVVFNCLAIAVDAVHRWNDIEKATEKTAHQLQGKQGKESNNKIVRRRMKAP